MKNILYNSPNNFVYSSLISRRHGLEAVFPSAKNLSSRFGVSTVKQTASKNIAEEINQLTNISGTNITDTRNYINPPKKNKTGVNAGSRLVSALRQQAKKINQFYGIKIKIYAEGNLNEISDYLSGEVFQLITEGLCKIKRQTKIGCSSINIECDEKRLKIKFQNNNSQAFQSNEFFSKSMSKRTTSLKGKNFIETVSNQTTISIEIPVQ